jgi:hypothetical protein
MAWKTKVIVVKGSKDIPGRSSAMKKPGSEDLKKVGK